MRTHLASSPLIMCLVPHVESVTTPCRFTCLSAAARNVTDVPNASAIVKPPRRFIFILPPVLQYVSVSISGLRCVLTQKKAAHHIHRDVVLLRDCLSIVTQAHKI